MHDRVAFLPGRLWTVAIAGVRWSSVDEVQCFFGGIGPFIG